MIFDDCEDFDYSIYDSEPNEPNEYTRCFGYDRPGPPSTPRPPDIPSRLTPRNFVEWQSNFSRMTEKTLGGLALFNWLQQLLTDLA